MGSNSNLFHQEVAKQTTDPTLWPRRWQSQGDPQRSIGTADQFAEDADLPTDLLRMESSKAK